jgi:peptide/nickel transport system substrate-binding protein
VGQSEYWTRWNRRRLGRRGVIGGGASAALGIGAFALVGCGDDDSDEEGTSTPGGTNEPEDVDVSDNMFGALESKVGDKVVMAEDTFYKTTNQKSGGTVNLNSQYQGATVFPLRSFSGDNNISHHIHQGLFKLNEEGGLHLEACDSIEEVDELTWTVHLRDNLKFHPLPPVNGRAVTGEDVKASFELGFADVQSYYANQNRFIDTIEVMPGNMIKFTSKFPNAMRFDPFQILIMAPEAIEQFGDAVARKAVGSGPLMLDGEYNPDAVTNLLRHPEFMIAGRPFPEKATFRSITDQAAHVAAFRSGQIDYVAAPLPQQIAESAKGSDGHITKLPFTAPEMLWFNQAETSPMKDERLRQAVSLAVDRAELIEKLVFGDGQLNAPIPWGLPAWALPEEEVVAHYKPDDYEANLAQAKTLVEQAGGDSIPEIVMINQSDITIPKDMAPLIVDMLGRAGLKVKVQTFTTNEWIGALYSGQFALSCNQWGNDAGPLFFLSMYTGPAVTAAASNRSGGFDEAVDEAVNKAVGEFDAVERQKLVYDAQRLIMKSNVAALNLFDGNAYYLRKNYFKDFRPGDTTTQYTQWDYWLDKA